VQRQTGEAARLLKQKDDFMKKTERAIAIAVILLSGIYIVPSLALAHRVNLFAWVEEDTVFVESKFAGGKRVKAGKIIVLDPDGKELLSGVTNDNGEFSFKIPKSADLKVILIAGQGHQAEWTINESEFGQLPGNALKESNTGKIMPPKNPSADPSSTTSTESEPVALPVDLNQLETLIENVLDKKLKPITKMLVDTLDRSPTVRDIFGGIGYILGLIGIAAYTHNRKKKDL
jgi:nickel transport protein